MINETETGRETNGNGSANLVLAFLTGASVGAAAGLLLAPKTGRESRNQLRGYIEKTRDKLKSFRQEAEETSEETAEKVKETVGNGSSKRG